MYFPRWSKISQLSWSRWWFTEWRGLLNHLCLSSLISLMLQLIYILVSYMVSQLCSELNFHFTSWPGSRERDHFTSHFRLSWIYHSYFLLHGLYDAIYRGWLKFFLLLQLHNFKPQLLHSIQRKKAVTSFGNFSLFTIHDISFFFQQIMWNKFKLALISFPGKMASTLSPLV